MRRGRLAVAVFGSALVASVALVPSGLADPPAQDLRTVKKAPAAESAKKKKKKKACPAAASAKKKKKKATCPAKPSPGPSPAPGPSPTPPATTPPTPPAPGFSAPPLDPTIATSMEDSARFLYDGPNAVQTGVDPEDIDEQRVAVLRGTVVSRSGAPLPGVKVAVLDHPELGETTTRSDGAYDIAVNGGGALTLTYEKAGVLPVERRLDVPWQDYVILDVVAMTPRDPASTTIQSGAAANQTARSSVVTDPQGSRRVTMVFKPGTTAQITKADGSTQALPGPWTVRATEYTVGGAAHNAMPAELPPTSGYTFATELTIDEAEAAGGVRTDFNNPVSIYVDNFIEMPVGADMPSGFHHEEGDGLWKADPDGRVMRLESVTGGLADLNVDKDGAIDTGAELTALGIDDAERATLAGLYSPGDEFWRVPTTHFSEVDHNTPNGLPAGATGPPPSEEAPPEDPTLSCGSIVSCEDQVLRERLPVTGTPFDLYYASDRVPGRDAESELDVRVTGPSVNSDIKGVVVQATVAGRLFESYYAQCAGGCGGTFPDLVPNITWTIPWDGTDVYGRPVQGKVPIQIRINYVYPVVRYETPDAAAKSFGSIGKPGSEFPAFNGCSTLSVNGASPNPYTSPFCGIVVSRNESRGVGAWDARGINGLGGWSLDVHHGYDPNEQAVHLGDGLVQQAELQPDETTLAAGGGSTVFPAANGGSAASANTGQVADTAVAPDGTLYVLSQRNVAGTGGVFRVERDGTIQQVSSLSSIMPGNTVFALTVDEAERVYVAYRDPSIRSFVLRVDPDGSTSAVAGTAWSAAPTPAELDQDGPAGAAKLMRVEDLAMGPDGNLYLADDGQSGVGARARIRKIEPSTGLISNVAGGASTDGAAEDTGNGEPAFQHSMEGIRGIAFGPDGTLYAAMSLDDTVVQVGIDGTLKRFAGTGTGGSPNEGFAPLNSPLETPSDLAVSADGTVLIRTRHAGSSTSTLILSIADDRVTTLAGNTSAALITPFANGNPATKTSFQGDRGLALAPDGVIYARATTASVFRVAPRYAGFGGTDQVATSEDGSELWTFDEEGRHLRTVDAVTGTTLHSFAYDSAGRLSGVTDRDGRTTTIQRDPNGDAAAIVAPGGARTELDLNSNGYATQVRDPRGAATTITYDGGGLMTRLVDRRGGQHDYSYDGDGRLTVDDGPGSRIQTFDLTEGFYDNTVTKTTGAGRETDYRTRTLPNGDVEQTTTMPSGAVSTRVRKRDGSLVMTDPDGTVMTMEFTPDPRFGMEAPILSREIVTSPGGRTTTATSTRAATLSNPSDPFSFTTLTDTETVDGETSTLTYTKASRTFQAISAGNRRITAVLDSRDRPTSLTPGLGRTPITYTYDGVGNLTDAQRGTLHDEFGWDLRDRLISETDAEGRGATYGYDAGDRMTTLTDGEGNAATLGYDGEGSLTSLTEPGAASAHAIAVDGYGESTGYTPPGGGASQSTPRDAEGQPNSVSLGAGHSFTIGRDAGGRHTTSTAAGPENTTFTYVGNTDRVESASTDLPGAADDQAVALEYDGQEQTKITFSGGARAAEGTITLAYDGRGNVTQRKVKSGADPETTSNLTYDDDDLLTADGPYSFTRAGALGETTQVSAGAGPTLLDRDNGYDSLGRPTTLAATVGGPSVFSETHTYDDGNLLATRSENVAGTPASLAYDYDDAGRLTAVANGGSSESYGYDAAGNRTTRSGPATGGSTETATYDSQGRLDARGGIDYTFDGAGFLTQRGSDTFSYGAYGQLLSANIGGSAVSYTYDGLGRRTSRTEAGGTESYLYGSPFDPWQLTASRDPAGVLTEYTYDPEGLLTGFDRGGARHYVFTDLNGSPRLVTSTSGATVKRITYDAFGEVVGDTNPGFALRVGYAGGLKDPTSGLVAFGYRDYEPASGRFTSRDPVLFAGGQTNLYAYVGNDPVNRIDPDGLKGKFVVGNWKSGPAGARTVRNIDSSDMLMESSGNVLSEAMEGYGSLMGRRLTRAFLGLTKDRPPKSPCDGGGNDPVVKNLYKNRELDKRMNPNDVKERNKFFLKRCPKCA